MIPKSEILAFTRELRLTPHIVEKDYVLGWILAGIFHHPALAGTWVFKGGTCLKKCFFETYRFSEDLDFTILDACHLDEAFLRNTFEEISDWVYAHCGVELPIETITIDLFENPRGNLSCQGKIGFIGPLQRRARKNLPKIKLDLVQDEILVLPSVLRDLHHPYSDTPEKAFQILCYAFEEVFAEKIRALSERARPRDLYDVIHLYRHPEFQPDAQRLRNTLLKKCEFKELPMPTWEGLENHSSKPVLISEWKNMLAHQLPMLPPFEQFWNQLPEFFQWLRQLQIVPPPVMPVMGSLGQNLEETWRPPAMPTIWNTPVSLEIIRFAASNRLCVDLTYNRSVRRIEPYSLRKTREGNLLLYAVKSETGEIRTYRVDRIQEAIVTETPFTPRYPVDLTSTGPLSSAPEDFVTSASPLKLRRRPQSSSRVPKNVFQCSVCQKLFYRQKYNSRLNPHKNKQGYPCSGRTGIFVKKQYPQ